MRSAVVLDCHVSAFILRYVFYFLVLYKWRSYSGKMAVGGGSVGVSVAYVSTDGL